MPFYRKWKSNWSFIKMCTWNHVWCLSIHLQHSQYSHTKRYRVNPSLLLLLSSSSKKKMFLLYFVSAIGKKFTCKWWERFQCYVSIRAFQCLRLVEAINIAHWIAFRFGVQIINVENFRNEMMHETFMGKVKTPEPKKNAPAHLLHIYASFFLSHSLHCITL